MIVESQLDLVSALLMFIAAIVPTYLTLKLRGNVRILTLFLAAFVIAHGIYHSVRMSGLELLADSVFEPISVVMMIMFGMIYLGVSSRRKQEAIR